MPEILNYEDITYDNLAEIAKHTSYTDHIPHFRSLFHVFKPKRFLEWGCGYSTKVFLSHCEHVSSVEILLDENDDLWLKECEKIYQNCENWLPIRLLASTQIRDACIYQSSEHKDYAEIDATYVAELNDALLSHLPVEISFIDAGVYIRGDLVELSLQQQIPVVIAHDTANLFPDYPNLTYRKTNKGLYGWFKIKEHDEYEKIFLDHGQGTMFWIHKSKQNLIDAMQYHKDLMMLGKTNENEAKEMLQIGKEKGFLTELMF